MEEWVGVDPSDDGVPQGEEAMNRGQINDFNFLRIVEKFGKWLLEKAQTPVVKKKKKEALLRVIEGCLDQHGVVITEGQVKRKLNNLKLRVKQKVDRKKTGNLPILLNAADKLLLEMLDYKENPSITQLPCK